MRLAVSGCGRWRVRLDMSQVRCVGFVLCRQNQKKPCKVMFIGQERGCGCCRERAWLLACPFGHVAGLSRRFCAMSPESIRIEKKTL